MLATRRTVTSRVLPSALPPELEEYREHLQFVRWLVWSGRMSEWANPADRQTSKSANPARTVPRAVLR